MTEEQPDIESEAILSSDALDWSVQFEKHFREAFQFACTKLPSSASNDEFQAAAIEAFIATIKDSGIKDAELVELFGRSLWKPVKAEQTWTEEKNSRRTELIDKMFLDSITNIERFELGALTQAMRAAIDTEENIPLSGAKKLYSDLLELSDDD